MFLESVGTPWPEPKKVSLNPLPSHRREAVVSALGVETVARVIPRHVGADLIQQETILRCTANALLLRNKVSIRHHAAGGTGHEPDTLDKVGEATARLAFLAQAIDDVGRPESCAIAAPGCRENNELSFRAAVA